MDGLLANIWAGSLLFTPLFKEVDVRNDAVVYLSLVSFAITVCTLGYIGNNPVKRLNINNCKLYWEVLCLCDLVLGTIIGCAYVKMYGVSLLVVTNMACLMFHVAICTSHSDEKGYLDVKYLLPRAIWTLHHAYMLYTLTSYEDNSGLLLVDISMI